MSFYLVVVATLLFFAFTRTRAGRAELQRQVEQQFAARFDGRLEIGSLEGNVVYSLLAKDVRLLAPDGALVASIDSIRTRPTWSGLLRRTVEFDRLDIRGARATLRQDSSGSWNIGRALRLRRFSVDGVATPTAPSLVLPRFTVQRSSISVESDAPRHDLVASGHIFDFLEATYTIDDARVAMDWTTSSRQIDIIGLRASIEQPDIQITDATAQMIFGLDRIDVADLQFTTAGSKFEAVAGLDREIEPGRRYPAGRLRVAAARLDPQELSRLFPLQPFRRTVEFSAEVAGTVDDFVIHESLLRHAGSSVELDGLAAITSDSIKTDLTIRSRYLSILDVDALLPDRGIGRFFAVDSIAGDAFIQASAKRGSLRSVDFNADIQSDLQTGAGAIATTATVRRSNGIVAYVANLSAADVDASGASGGRLPPSLLSGSAYLESTSLIPSRASGRYELNLANSWYDGIRIDTLVAGATGTIGVYKGSARLVQAASSLRGDLVLDLATITDGVDVQATIDANAVDIARFVKSDSVATRLTGNADFRWTQNEDASEGSATLTLDSSQVLLGSFEQHIPASRTDASLRSDRLGLRVRLGGDLATASIESSSPLADLNSSLPNLLELVGRHVARLRPASYSDPVQRPLLRGLPDYRPYADLAVSIGLRSDSTLASLLARQSLHIESGTVRFDMVSDSTGVHLSGDARADSVVSRSSTSFRPALRLSASLPADSAQSIRAEADVSADNHATATRMVANPMLHLTLRDGNAILTGSTSEAETIGPLDVRLTARFDGRKWIARFDDFHASASGYTLSTRGVHSFSLFRDAVSVSDLSFVSPGPDGRDQSMDLNGTFSPDQTDTLIVGVSRVDLKRLSAFAGLHKPLEGSASGNLRIVQVNGVPVLAGQVDVDRIGLDGRVLGDFHGESRFSARNNEVDVLAEITPARNPGPGSTAKPDVANELTIDGSIRFSGSSPSRRTDLDLNVDVRRADMFFFEYIFPHTVEGVTGALTGTGSITGSTDRPVFGADLKLASGRFAVPEFNLDLGITGDVTVDADAVRITRATVTDSDGGVAVVTGDVLFNDYRYFSLNLTGDLTEFQIMDISHSNELPFYGDIQASGRLTLDGPISGATLRATDAVTNATSEVYIPLVSTVGASDESFIVFADSTGRVSEAVETTRRNVLSQRPRGERTFLDGLELDLNLFAPPGSTVHLVIDPLVGDVINAVGTGRVQIRRRGGEFSTFGFLEVNSGDYLFTAGDVFVRRFSINEGGRITWDGDPTNAILDIPASYATRASRAGLPGTDGTGSAIPLIVRLRITGRVESPEVDLSLEVDRTNRELSGNYAALEAILNQPSRSTQYATSVLVSNSFLLTTSDVGTDVLASSAFNSVSQLVASQINRYLNEALPNVDFSFGVQGESTQELGVTYGVALRLLDERLVIRGQGVYQGARAEASDVASQNLEGEFIVEVKLSPTVSVEVFYRREGDVLTNNATLTGSTGAGVSYSTEFSTWRRFFSRIFRRSSASQPATDS